MFEFLKSRGKRNPEGDLGRAGERHAAAFLKKQGYRILDTNVEEKGGEIDLVALEGKTVCFIEVKTRRSETSGTPEEAVTEEKIRHIVRAAKAYKARNHLENHPVRYDVVALREREDGTFDSTLIRGAFYEDGWS